jgi:hypothetical protein
MLFYRAALPLSSRTLNFVARIIRRYRKEIGSLWRRLDPGQQALLVLAYLKKGETYPLPRALPEPSFVSALCRGSQDSRAAVS